MKINGKQPGVFTKHVAFERVGGYVGFVLTPPNDLDRFEQICPLPKPPTKQLPNGSIQKNFEDAGYKSALVQWSLNKFNWVYLETMKTTPGLEWEKVKLDNPDTYNLWTEELKESGLSTPEINYLYAQIRIVNGLDEDKLNEARDNFLAQMLEGQATENSQQAEPNSI